MNSINCLFSHTFLHLMVHFHHFFCINVSILLKGILSTLGKIQCLLWY